MRQVCVFLVVFLAAFSTASVAHAYVAGLSDAVQVISEAAREISKITLVFCGIGVCVGVGQVSRGNPSGWAMIFSCVVGVLVVLYWPDAQHALEQKKGF